MAEVVFKGISVIVIFGLFKFAFNVTTFEAFVLAYLHLIWLVGN